MLTPWKVIIVRYLRDPDPENLINELRSLWPELHPDDKDSIYHFLFLSKQWLIFLELFILDAKENATNFPWVYFLTILLQSKIEVPDKQKSVLIKNLKRQKIRIPEDSDIKEIIQLLLTKKRYAFLQIVQSKKQDLLSSAKIAKSEQLYEKQVDYLKKLKNLFPSDNSVKEIISERDRFNAEQVLSRVSRTKKKKRKEHPSLSPEETEMINAIALQAEKYRSKNNNLANDFSIMLRNFGDHNKSIDFINKSDNQTSKDWQLLDLLLIGRQFIDLLSHCELLKSKYANQPNALFAVSYAEAISYWELGEKGKAIQLMSQIASMKPDFKSANEILIEWKEESIE